MYLRAILVQLMIGVTLCASEPASEELLYLGETLPNFNEELHEWLMSTCPGYNENDHQFQGKDISGAFQRLTLVKRQLMKPNQGITTVYDVVEPFPKELRNHLVREHFGKGTHLLKLVDINDLSASCEPYALKKFNIWHRAGIRKEYGIEYGAILLRVEPGFHIDQDEKWLNAPEDQRKAYLDKAKSELAEMAYQHSFETPKNDVGLVQSDFHSENVLFVTKVDEDGEIHPEKIVSIDFGKPGVLITKEKPSKEVHNAWLGRRFDLGFNHQYILKTVILAPLQMYLGNILLQLIVGATLFPAINPLPTPPAPNPIPTGPIQIQLWQRIPQPWPHDAFKAWRRDQLRVLDSQQDWLQLPIGGVKCRGYDENNLVFWNGISDTIHSLKLVKMQGVSPGGFNLGVYNVTQSFSLPVDPIRYSGGGTYLVKLVDITKPTASSEPYALQKLNIWHRTGIQVEGDKVYGAILLKRELGTHLAEDERWKTSSLEWKKQYLSALESIMRNIVYHLFFMTPTNDDQLGPISKKTPSNAVFDTWFIRRFKLLWFRYYIQIGDHTILNEFAAHWFKEQHQRLLAQRGQLAIPPGDSSTSGARNDEGNQRKRKGESLDDPTARQVCNACILGDMALR
ncbi:hypothetical protein F5878DRAFT_644936 [Lentinula raphanica]|uniref:Aminoglycoside phosphotransferase domain-containing protein n=1 Tax=Lentinula raphanica TaxID=153919 RepID=A0AA38P1W1_9AGAR|nr:hypothetical protein F5878DRAFT_644936 [Lentinula raphanica]